MKKALKDFTDMMKYLAILGLILSSGWTLANEGAICLEGGMCIAASSPIQVEKNAELVIKKSEVADDKSNLESKRDSSQVEKEGAEDDNMLPPPPPPPGEACDHEGKPGERRGPQHGRRWHDFGQVLFTHHLIIRKYDVNENGKLDEPEIEKLKQDIRRFEEDRKARILKEFDLDKDGELNDEEKKNMRNVIRERMKKFAPPRDVAGKNIQKGEDRPSLDEKESKKAKKDAPVNEQQEDTSESVKDSKEKSDFNDRKEGRDTQSHRPANNAEKGGKDGRHRGNRMSRMFGDIPEPQLMMVGFHLIMERFDLDKDGRLSRDEMKMADEAKKEVLKKHRENMARLHKERKEKGATQKAD